MDQELEALARLQHWWWAKRSGDATFAGASGLWWRKSADAAVQRTIEDCDGGLEEERDYIQPLDLLDRYYADWALSALRQMGGGDLFDPYSAEGISRSFSRDLLFGFPMRRPRDGVETAGGYLQHPTWSLITPRGQKRMMLGRLLTLASEEAPQGWLDRLGDTEKDADGESEDDVIVVDLTPLRRKAKPSSGTAMHGHEEQADMRRRLHAKTPTPEEELLRREWHRRRAAYVSRWSYLFEEASQALSGRNRAYFERFGPWEGCTYIHPTRESATLTPAERVGKLRARDAFLEEISAAAGYPGPSTFAGALLREPPEEPLERLFIQGKQAYVEHVLDVFGLPDADLRSALRDGGRYSRQVLTELVARMLAPDAQSKRPSRFVAIVIRFAAEARWFLPVSGGQRQEGDANGEGSAVR